MRALRVLLAGIALMWTSGCGGDDGATSGDSTTSTGVSTSENDAGPTTSTDVDAFVEPCNPVPGLFENDDCETLRSDLMPFAPGYVLWTDGATKERHIRLPEGETIDTSNPDHWVFPVGTEFYKSFYEGELLLETRLMVKEAGGWSFRVWAWEDARNAVEVTETGRQNVLGTDHDIPDLMQCRTCHEGLSVEAGMAGGNTMADAALGFSAVSLAAADPGDGFTLSTLNAMGLITDSVNASGPLALATANPSLGVLHANCGHCHGGANPTLMLNLRLSVAETTLEETGFGSTAIGVDAANPMGGSTVRVLAGSPTQSLLYNRASTRGMGQMPPLGTEAVPESISVDLADFISSLADR